ncbi:hypothetical protein BDA96_08G088000 [Sorghum bicolor]|uniref:Uncharacterized protein n=1 Tax=Sorghum bicolor TaxID=4558 RepID=A0A921U7M3_SORBI|nr:hypothetical protein BDA96_08G088000 [Sorghum bicolor]
MADGAHNDGGADDDGQGIYDPFLVPDDDFDDDVFNLLDMNGGMDAPPPPPPLQAAPGQSAVAAGPSGDNNLLEWPPPTLDYINDSVVDNRDPMHNNATLLADDPTTSSARRRRRQDMGVAGTSSAAAPRPPPPPSSSSAVHQNASLDCTGCQVLREIVHCNGLEATKLGVHGVAAGVFHHATLEVYRIDSNGLQAATMTTQLTHQSYVDFRGRDYVWVKHYLTNYARQRAGGGYVVLQDSISAFQDALCTSMVVSGGHADDHREAVAQEINGGHADDHREAVAPEINGGHQRVVGSRPADDDGGAVQPAMVEQGSVPAETSAEMNLAIPPFQIYRAIV